MDEYEDRVPTADTTDDGEFRSEREGERSDERDQPPSVEPYDPYFGRQRRERYSWQ